MVLIRINTFSWWLSSTKIIRKQWAVWGWGKLWDISHDGTVVFLPSSVTMFFRSKRKILVPHPKHIENVSSFNGSVHVPALCLLYIRRGNNFSSVFIGTLTEHLMKMKKEALWAEQPKVNAFHRDRGNTLETKKSILLRSVGLFEYLLAHGKRQNAFFYLCRWVRKWSKNSMCFLPLPSRILPQKHNGKDTLRCFIPWCFWILDSDCSEGVD